MVLRSDQMNQQEATRQDFLEWSKGSDIALLRWNLEAFLRDALSDLDISFSSLRATGGSIFMINGNVLTLDLTGGIDVHSAMDDDDDEVGLHYKVFSMRLHKELLRLSRTHIVMVRLLNGLVINYDHNAYDLEHTRAGVWPDIMIQPRETIL